MKNHFIISSVLLTLTIIYFYSCSEKGNPVVPVVSQPALYGKVVDSLGNPIAGAKVHYIPRLVNTNLQSSAIYSPNVPNRIEFSLESQSRVTLFLLNYGTHDTIFYLINNKILNAGHYSIGFNSDTLTNGIYEYILKCDALTLNKTILIIKDTSNLISTIPLTISDNEGNFKLTYKQLGIGKVFGIKGEGTPEIIGYKAISDTIDIFIVKENYGNCMETIKLDTNSTIKKNFVLTQL